MPRKVFLPLTQRFADSVVTPSVAAMRDRLGGRVAISTDAVAMPLGSLVTLAGTERVGVLLAATDESVDVYLDHGTVKRTLPSGVAPHRGSAPPDLANVAESVHVFARLGEGQRVSVERGAGLVVAGTLVEKCRYGAIVELDDRSTLAVGFRKLWPSAGSPVSS